MRILYLTNYYPPHYIGGYELHCQRVAQWLSQQGHAVRILSSDFRLEDIADDAPTDGPEVFRHLQLRYWKDITELGYWQRERRDLAILRLQMHSFKPDIVVLWNMAKLASGLVMEAQRLSPVLVYHLMDEWVTLFQTGNGLPQFWARPANSFWGRCTKPILRKLYRLLLSDDVRAWHPRNAILVSHALGKLLDKNDLQFEKKHVSFITYEPALFPENLPRDPGTTSPVRFLWAGRLCRGKGLETTLKALDILHQKMPEGWTLDFCGPIDMEDDTTLFSPRLSRAPWRNQVQYLGSLPHDKMPAQYRKHDIFLFTSEVHEGLPGTIVEAFASGLGVIGTLTGGTHDVLFPDQNCLVYPIGDANALAQAMQRMIQQPELRQQLSSEVRKFAQENCSSDIVFPQLFEFYQQLITENQSALP